MDVKYPEIKTGKPLSWVRVGCWTKPMDGASHRRESKQGQKVAWVVRSVGDKSHWDQHLRTRRQFVRIRAGKSKQRTGQSWQIQTDLGVSRA